MDDRSKEKEVTEKIYGIAAAEMAFRVRSEEIHKILVRKGEEGRHKNLLAQAAKKRIAYKLVSEEELSKASQSAHHEGICLYIDSLGLTNYRKILSKEVDPAHSASRIILVLDGVQNPHNIGGILRTAGFFGIAGVIVLSKSSISLSGSLARMSEGGSEVVTVALSRDTRKLIDDLRSAGVYIYVADLEKKGGGKKKSPAKGQKIALVLGAERVGVSKAFQDAADGVISIPGTVYETDQPSEFGEIFIQSLNVSVSTGIVLDRLIEGSRS